MKIMKLARTAPQKMLAQNSNRAENAKKSDSMQCLKRIMLYSKEVGRALAVLDVLDTLSGSVSTL